MNYIAYRIEHESGIGPFYSEHKDFEPYSFYFQTMFGNNILPEAYSDIYNFKPFHSICAFTGCCLFFRNPDYLKNILESKCRIYKLTLNYVLYSRSGLQYGFFRNNILKKEDITHLFCDIHA